ncbi:phosphohexomutase domain-containing protein [Pseudomonas chlororaphis]|uniref:phosphomannomutase/phosphoglucomutase n=1 Tax=Pseudomonas chlororaphis TaxID=587753 RepID=UPI0003D3A20D|nr:phosphomannomutase/phosphoglucomutase [Pseudomonas chlororaphis]AZD30996.1 Phosphomannomutase [Pseudomonas chlororaphis]ETD39860.1 phosphomannomutase [Pseudomonas chlororaphis subsp. aurantiaca PB-St2]QFS56333.1 phosphomannomutase/phosphoglucomutase [Pseudomonas chlororaphis subsp. aurantiaca]
MHTPIKTQCFKAYDIRGQVPSDLNEDVAYRIGRAMVAELQGKSVVLGWDMRLESPMLAEAMTRGLCDAGANVVDIGLCGTEEVYFATNASKADGGVMITASHNPKGYNGMKLVKSESRPISGDTGLNAIRDRVESGDLGVLAATPGEVRFELEKKLYIEHLLSYVNIADLKPLKILADPGNGAAGPVLQELAHKLPFEWVMINAEPDGNFPNGVPNPLLPENRDLTQQALLAHGCDLGLAWDGDFDRCFFFDEKGRFIEGYYLVGLLAEMLLKQHPGSKIIHDPRLTWNTIDQVQQACGVPVLCKTGHAFIKERMRLEDAIYGGEMSAHHYFRDFAYCDSGMIPWLLVTALMSTTGKTLAQLVNERISAFPCSGEINYRVENIPTVIEKIREYYAQMSPRIDITDGLSMEFDDWRFNLRGSNTEPLLRLNIETRADMDALSLHQSTLDALILGVDR